MKYSNPAYMTKNKVHYGPFVGFAQPEKNCLHISACWELNETQKWLNIAFKRYIFRKRLFSQQLNSRFCRDALLIPESCCHLSVIFLSYVTPAVHIFTLWNICIVQSFTAVAQHVICSPYKPLQDLDFYNVMRCSGKQQHPDGALCLCIKSAGAGCCLFPLLFRAWWEQAAHLATTPPPPWCAPPLHI